MLEAAVWVAPRAGARDGCGAHLEGQRRPRNGTAVGKDVGREGARKNEGNNPMHSQVLFGSLRHMFGTLLHDDEDAIEPAAWTEYLRCFRHSETIRATCDEYRAGASIDLVHDRADLSQKVRVPMQHRDGQEEARSAGNPVLAPGFRRDRPAGHILTCRPIFLSPL